MIDPKELEAFEKLVNASTPGPWEHHNWDVMERPHVVAHALWNGKEHCNGHFDVPCTFENTAFIAASRAMVPKLIEEVKLYKQAVQVMAEELKDIRLEMHTDIPDPDYVISSVCVALNHEAVKKVLK